MGTAYLKPVGTKRFERNDLLIKGKKSRNRAVHGDVVVVQLLEDEDAEENDEDVEEEKEELEMPPGLAPVFDESDEESNSDEEQVRFQGGLMKTDQDNSVPQSSSHCGRVQGDRERKKPKLFKVVAIVDASKGSRRVVVCTLHPNEKSSEARLDNTVRDEDRLLRATPTDRRMPWILIQINDITKKALDIPGPLDKYQLWPVQMISWKSTSSLPLGRLKGQCLGQAGELEAEERHALIEHQLNEHDVDFEDAQQDDVDQIVVSAQREFENEVLRRDDLRRKRIFTIDPATAKDLDDAIHVDLISELKQVEIGVHIADVGHFVKLNSLTDKEAQRRTTSVYLINRVIPMLPHGLCNHLCSLNPNEAKLSFSAFFRLDIITGELVETPQPWFKKTAIKSCCRLNYDEVQDVLDGKHIDEPAVYGGWTWKDIKEDIFLLYDVCGRVRDGRLGGGALTISKQKMIFHTRESEDGTPTGYHLEAHSASHWIIEELMLLANRCVAKHLAQSRLLKMSVLRKHERPDEKKADQLDKLLNQNLGIRWDSKDAGCLFRSCQAIYEKYGEMLGLCVEMMVMRGGMKQAEYFVYKDPYGETYEDPHHFALNFEYYTHFTSPIRRYPDVMVHRVLEALLAQSDEGFHDTDGAEERMEDCNDKKTACRRCSEQIDRAVFCIYLRSMKEWFYTIGTVLKFMKDNSDSGNDTLEVYCSQLGKESKARLCTTATGTAELFTNGVDDELLLPNTWRWRGRNSLELEWVPPDGDKSRSRVQQLQTLTCSPIVIIPTNTVPIDYAMFFVSPFHPRYESMMRQVPEKAQQGFAWQEEEEDGVETVYDAMASDGR